MFHRNNGHIKPQSRKEAEAQEQARREAQESAINQTAVKRHIKSQEEVEADHLANQNSTEPYAVKQGTTTQDTQIPKNKEARPMNNPNPNKNQQQQNNQPSQAAGTQPQARVDIPGNNFQQRPGAQAAAQGNRPAYPGTSYPGSSAATSNGNYTAQANDAASGRQLVIGQGITMSGEIEACDHLVVEGTVEAALKGASVMEIAESGAFYGTVEIDEANISGRFEGDITVKGRLTIQATGVIIGSVSYKELSMEAGATLDGSVSPIGSQNAVAQQGGNRKSAPKAKKVSHNNGAELPFSDRAAAAAE